MFDATRGAFIGLADDHAIVRSRLRFALGALGPATRFAEAANLVETLALLTRHVDLDLLLLGFHLPGVRIAEVAQVRAAVPALRMAVISADDDPGTVSALLSLGVAGYIPKAECERDILAAVRVVLAGGTYVPARLLQPPGSGIPHGGALDALTGRQREVLALLARGLPNKMIARELGLTEGTVKVHLFAIFRALNVHNRTEAVLVAQGQR